ncbi:sulfatase [Vibrio tubiashii]|nr:sulfatase [Vibrio tubiashii]
MLSFGAYASTSTQALEQTKSSHAQPNIVMILLDDVGFAEVGSYGSEIKTPNIDALAYDGLRYNRFDTATMSGPTRAALVTGRNPQTVNMEDLAPTNIPAPDPSVPFGSGLADSGELPLNAETVAEALKKVGYQTNLLGKWHLAPSYTDDLERNMKAWPLQRGFDYFYGFLDGHTSQWEPDLVENNSPIPTPKKDGYHLSVDLVDRAIDIMQPGDKPNFVYLSFGAAHSPLHVPKSYIDDYKGKYSMGWDELRKQRFAKQKELGIIPANTVLSEREKGDAAWDEQGKQHKLVFERFMETYAGFMTHTDEQIGRLVDHLKETGQYENTLIIFATDNGAAPEAGPEGGFRKAYRDTNVIEEMGANLDEAGGPNTYMMYPRPWAWAGSTPFRRYKLWPYAGGVRVPMIVSWPAIIEKPGIRTQYSHVIDLAPTMLEAAGTSFSDEINGVEQIPVAGMSLVNTFNDENADGRQVQYFQLRGARAITSGKWRAIAINRLDTEPSEDVWQLFDTDADFSESNDLAEKHPEIVKELKALWWEQANELSNPPLTEAIPLKYNFAGLPDAFDD